MSTLDEIAASGRTHPSVRPGIEFFQGITDPPETNSVCVRARENQELLRAGVRRALEEHELDALVYPTWSNPPRLIGDLNTPHGDNSQYIPPHTGFPGFTVPMGYVRDGLPVGLQIVGDAWAEPTLIAIAYGFEQATNHRRLPQTTPPLPGRR